MWKQWFVVLSFCVAGINILPSVSGSLQDVATLCPYNNFCTSNATKSRTPDEMHLTSCCQMCSCDPDCQLFGNCCHDMKLTPGVEVKYPCVDLNTYFNEPRGLDADTVYDLHYRIIDSCPNSVLGLAYPRCSNFLKLEDSILVTDPSTDRVYKNKHCAVCNGVKNQDLIQWKLITDCHPDDDYSSMEEWHDYIKSNCSLTPYPPDPSVGQLFRCQLNILTAVCNFTGRWDIYNQDIKEACELENKNPNNNIYTHIDNTKLSSDSINYFYNVYCAVCNRRHDEIWPDLCTNDINDESLRGSFGLSVFIDFKEKPGGDEIKTARCDPSQIWNPFNASCLTVKCPIATYAFNGKCVDLLKNLPGQVYDIRFQLESLDDVDSVELVTFLDQVVTSMFANVECTKCLTTLASNTGINKFVLRYTLTSQGTCTEEYILSKVEIISKHSPLNLRFKGITLSMVPDFYVRQVVDDDIEGVLSFRYCSEPIRINFAMVDKCPRIPTPSWSLNKTTTYITSERDGTICVNEYFRIMTSLTNSQIAAQCHVIMPIFVVVVCVFQLYNIIRPVH